MDRLNTGSVRYLAVVFKIFGGVAGSLVIIIDFVGWGSPTSSVAAERWC